MILTVVSGYPNEQSRYNNNFVHARVKAYLREGIDSKVFIIGSNETDYTYEGVSVLCGSKSRLIELVNSRKDINCVCFHFLSVQMLKAINMFQRDIAITIFVHGNEALWWYERIFPDKFSDIIRVLKFIKYVLINTYSINYIKRRINLLGNNANLVCVSEWMKDVVVRNWKIDTSKIKVHIIPNIIDEKLFPYHKKTIDKRFNILMIRSFTNGKYALDIAMDIVSKLQKYPEAKDIRVTVVGDGWLHEKYTSRIKNFPNVTIEKRMLSQPEIVQFHEQNGIFLCPTRQDAQGVSMCEAMSSGLVPISSNNTAIPEFLPSEYNLALNTAEESAERIISLIRNPDEYLTLSERVSAFIRQKCNIEMTTGRELTLMRSLNQ